MPPVAAEPVPQLEALDALDHGRVVEVAGLLATPARVAHDEATAQQRHIRPLAPAELGVGRQARPAAADLNGGVAQQRFLDVLEIPRRIPARKRARAPPPTASRASTLLFAGRDGLAGSACDLAAGRWPAPSARAARRLESATRAKTTLATATIRIKAPPSAANILSAFGEFGQPVIAGAPRTQFRVLWRAKLASWWRKEFAPSPPTGNYSQEKSGIFIARPRCPQKRTSLLRSSTRSIVRHLEFDATVLGSVGFRVVRHDRPRFAVAGRRNVVGSDAFCDQVVDYRLRALLRELSIESFCRRRCRCGLRPEI